MDAKTVHSPITHSISALINSDHSNPVSHMGEGPFFANYKVLVPVCLSIIAIGSFIGIVILIRKRKLTNQNRLPSASISESPSTANLQNKQNRDQQYQVVRCQSNRNSNSNDSGSFKAEGNGEWCWCSLQHFQSMRLNNINFSRRHRIHRRHLSIRHIPIE